MKPFLDNDFLLDTPTARHLYHDYASAMPIIDYHSHLPAHDIATRRRIRDIGELWLGGDHYKWRLMRMAGLPERLVTGDADNREKFLAFCRILPDAIGNPVYHWSHLGLRRLFKIDCVINEANAPAIWDAANARLKSMDAWSFLEQANVEVVCTTDDPADDLSDHAALAESGLRTRVLPTFRPDRAMRINAPDFANYLQRLGNVASIEIRSFADLVHALEARVSLFHKHGGRVSDHSIEVDLPDGLPTDSELERLFARRLEGGALDTASLGAYQFGLLLRLGHFYSSHDWAMCFHIGARRNNNSRAFKELGPDAGFDSVADAPATEGLSLLLDSLDREKCLPRTILFCLNPALNEVLASMAGNFSRDSAPGKMQLGPPWWFNDHQHGILSQLETLANYGVLGRFIGMTTDSRSFASYPRHEYFRRLLCRRLGRWVEDGEYPNDDHSLRTVVEGICYTNAKSYFGFPTNSTARG
jgi:glucuronate isomerase